MQYSISLRIFFATCKAILLLILLLMAFVPTSHADQAQQDVQPIQPIQSAGVVSWFDSQNGYGFITPHDNSQQVFVHFSAIVSPNQQLSLYQGQAVRFATVYRDGNPQALWVLPE